MGFEVYKRREERNTKEIVNELCEKGYGYEKSSQWNDEWQIRRIKYSTPIPNKIGRISQ